MKKRIYLDNNATTPLDTSAQAMKKRIYLDNNATTPLDPRVKEVIERELAEFLGNPSSIHSFGQSARARVVQARRIIANYFGVRPQELIFTSGGTEGINMVFQGLLGKKFDGHIVTSDVEHACVDSLTTQFKDNGAEVIYLSAGLKGAVDPEEVRAALTPKTCLITLIAANNETGVKTDIASIAAIAQERGIPFLVDGVALLGKEPMSIPEGVSAMCFSGHKAHAPAGIGVTFIRSSLKLSPLIIGGAQEYGKRGGTENVLGILALAEAIRLLEIELPEKELHMRRLRNRFESTLMENLPDVTVNGLGERVANTSNLSFAGVEGETLLTHLDLEGVAASHGSACSSGALEPSRVLRNMGIPKEAAASSVRFSLSRFTTEEEIDHATSLIIKIVSQLREITYSSQ